MIQALPSACLCSICVRLTNVLIIYKYTKHLFNFRFYILETIIIKCDISISARNESVFTFTEENHLDYVLYNGTLPEMSSLTVCAWVKPDKDKEFVKGSFISYCEPDGIDCNTFVVMLLSNGSRLLAVYVNSQSYRFSGAPLITTYSHLCVVVQPHEVSYYINGTEPIDSIDRGNYTKIPTGGVLIIGQDQDGKIKGRSPGQPTTPHQGFRGQIKGLRLWKRALSKAEIVDLHQSGGCNCATFNESNSILHGHVTSHYDICKG